MSASKDLDSFIVAHSGEGKIIFHRRQQPQVEKSQRLSRRERYPNVANNGKVVEKLLREKLINNDNDDAFGNKLIDERFPV